jgi:hypothetical protein
MITTLWLHLKIGQEKNNTRVFRNVKKTRHQNPEFGPKPGEIFLKKTLKRYISLQRGVKLRNALFFVPN